MKISYGPPGEVGVKQLQYIGDDADYTASGLHAVAKPLAAVAAGVGVYAWVTGDARLRRQALAVSLAALVVRLAT